VLQVAGAEQTLLARGPLSVTLAGECESQHLALSVTLAGECESQHLALTAPAQPAGGHSLYPQLYQAPAPSSGTGSGTGSSSDASGITISVGSVSWELLQSSQTLKVCVSMLFTVL